MPQILESPEHLQPRYMFCRVDRILSSTEKDFNQMHFKNVDK